MSKPNHAEATKYLGTRFYLCEKKLKDPEGIRWCLNNVGKVYLSMGNTRSAIPCFRQALKLAEGTGNLLSEGTAVGNLGSALREAGRYEEAVKCHKEYLSNASKRLDPGGEAIMLYELAVDHIHMGDINEAKKFALKGVVVLRNIQNVMHAALSSQDSQARHLSWSDYIAMVCSKLGNCLVCCIDNFIIMLHPAQSSSCISHSLGRI